MKQNSYIHKWLKYILLLTCVSTVCFMCSSCSSDDNDSAPESPASPEETENGIGTYRFRGIEHQIATGVFSVDEGGGITCILSPEDLSGESISTYFSIYLAGYWVGEERNTVTNDMWKNIDYTFIYEDLKYYYSSYQEVTGKIYIKRNTDTNLTVSLNLRLHDNVHFKADVTADLTKISSRNAANNSADIPQATRQCLQRIEKLKNIK